MVDGTRKYPEKVTKLDLQKSSSIHLLPKIIRYDRERLSSEGVGSKPPQETLLARYPGLTESQKHFFEHHLH